MSLCKYSEVFGRPGEGVHRERLFGMAAVDLLGTALGAYLLSIPVMALTNAVRPPSSSGIILQVVVTMLIFIMLMVLSLGVHSLFCVETALVKKVAEFSSPKEAEGTARSSGD